MVNGVREAILLRGINAISHLRTFMEKRFRLLIVDDQPRSRQSLSALLVIDFPHIEIFEASNGKEALRQVKVVQPDAIVMDALMPECDGMDATGVIKAIYPQIKIIIYSMYPEYKNAALSAGADVFIAKDEPSKILVDTIGSLINPNPDSISNHREEC
jgi:DNA-binding NarL/FixJ family response regulator